MPSASGVTVHPLGALGAAFGAAAPAALSAATAAAGVSGDPSWNFTPGRSRNCQRLPPGLLCQESASAGCGRPRSSRRTSRSNTRPASRSGASAGSSLRTAACISTRSVPP